MKALSEKRSRSVMAGVVGVDKELVRQHSARVQGAGDEEVEADPVTLWYIQDRVGLDDSAVYVLHSHHGAVQRRVRHDVAGQIHAAGVHCQ